MQWIKCGTAGNGKYGIWVYLDKDGRNVYRIQRAPIIPQGAAGYYSLTAQLALMGTKQDGPVLKGE